MNSVLYGFVSRTGGGYRTVLVPELLTGCTPSVTSESAQTSQGRGPDILATSSHQLALMSISGQVSAAGQHPAYSTMFVTFYSCYHGEWNSGVVGAYVSPSSLTTTVYSPAFAEKLQQRLYSGNVDRMVQTNSYRGATYPYHMQMNNRLESSPMHTPSM